MCHKPRGIAKDLLVFWSKNYVFFSGDIAISSIVLELLEPMALLLIILPYYIKTQSL